MTNNSHPEEFNQNHDSIAEFKNFNDLPNSPPLVIVDKNSIIKYANNTFIKYFNITEGEYLTLDSEPIFYEIFSIFAKSKYHDFHFDISFSKPVFSRNNFFVDVERIIINSSEYFIVILRTNEERFILEEKILNLNSALELGNIPVLITNEKGKIKYSTKSFEEVFNTTIEEIYNNFLFNILIDYLNHYEIKDLEDAILKGKNWEKIIKINVKEAVKYKELKLVPVFSDDNIPTNFILSANDITDYIIKNNVIEKSENRLRSIINNISDLLLILRRSKDSYYFENANDNFCKVFGLHKDYIIKKNIGDLFYPYFHSQLASALDKFHSNIAEDKEFLFTDKYARVYTGKITFIDDYEIDERIYIISLKDVTEQKHYEDQLQNAYKKQAYLSSLKTSFLENMSHEIRTPFNAIMGYSEIIEECSENGDFDTIKDMTFLVKDVLGRILNLFNNIVDVSQIESGEIEIEHEDYAVNDVLNAVYNKKYKEALEKGLKFTTKLEPQIILKGDQSKLLKIVMALVDNAIKYTEKGEVSIVSRIKNKDLIISINDSGDGIEEAQLKRLLEPFTQEKEGYTRKYEGAGLGLTIAYKLTKLLNGKFNISSKKNYGTNIYLTFSLD